MYKSVWNGIVRENLPCVAESSNTSDLYAVPVTKNGTIVGHVPRKVSDVCTIFLRKGGVILCEVTGSRMYSHDIPQGGLEIHVHTSFVVIKIAF